MKLGYLSGSVFPSRFANTVQVVSQCNGFSSNGVEVSLFGVMKIDETVSSIKDMYKIDSSIKLFLRRRKFEKSPFNIILNIIWILKYFNFRFDVLYVRNINLFIFIALLNKFKDSNIFIELHNPIGKLKFKIISRISKKFKKGIQIVYISEALKRIQQKINCDNKLSLKEIVAHDGCFENSNNFKFQQKLYSAGYVGGFYKGRGLDKIIIAASKLPAYKFHLIGGGKEDFLRLYDIDVPENVVFHGYINHSELYKYYELFDVCLALYDLNTSVPGGRVTVDYMSPLKIFEYMSFGKYIVASDLPVIKEVLTDKVNCRLVDFNDVNCIIKAICDYNNSLISEQLMLNAKNDSCKYTWNHRAKYIISNLVLS